MKRKPLQITTAKFIIELNDGQEYESYGSLVWIPMFCKGYELRAVQVFDAIRSTAKLPMSMEGTLGQMLDETISALGDVSLVVPRRILDTVSPAAFMSRGFTADENGNFIRSKT